MRRLSLAKKIIISVTVIVVLLVGGYFAYFYAALLGVRTVFLGGQEMMQGAMTLRRINAIYDISYDSLDFSNPSSAHYQQLKTIVNGKLTRNEHDLIHDASWVKHYVDICFSRDSTIPVTLAEYSGRFMMPEEYGKDDFGRPYFYRVFKGYVYIGSYGKDSTWNVPKEDLEKIISADQPLVYRMNDDMLIKIVPRFKPTSLDTTGGWSDY
jgi:hypothetical protein